MQIGMIGLGRMGSNMTQRLLRAGHDCVVWNADPAPIQVLEKHGAAGAKSPEELVARLQPPRAIWLMVPVAAVSGLVERLGALLETGDCIVDGGNSPYFAASVRARALATRGIDFLDVGTSGGVWGLERGYCLMIGGPARAVARLEPVFRALAPGRGDIAPVREPRPGETATEGFLHCGGTGAGHFAKMVHNAIEYGVMAAYAEGFDLLRHASRRVDAASAARVDFAPTAGIDSAPPAAFEFDLAALAELWRRGSVISSWLLDLTAAALAAPDGVDSFAGAVGDSGEGRWALEAALDTATPMPVLAAALHARFASRGEAAFANQLLSAMRHQFGGHVEVTR